jgi:trans-2-enoyl-CoA reductase
MIDTFVKLSVKKSTAVTADPLCSSLNVSMYISPLAENKRSKEGPKRVLPLVPVVGADAFAAHYVGLS